MMNPVGKIAPSEPRRGMPVGPEPRVGGMAPIMGTFHQGGTVPADGAYKMKRGEKVLTKEQTDHLKHSFGLAQAHLAHAAPEPMHKQPRKKIKSVHVSKSHNNGYLMHHMHHKPNDHPDKDETHIAASKEEMLKHMAAEQNQPEPPMEEPGEDPGQQQMESALGMK